jgi:hypothetical protein
VPNRKPLVEKNLKMGNVALFNKILVATEHCIFDRDAQSNQSGQAKGTGDDQQWNQQFRSLSGDSREGGGKESHDFFSCSRFQVAVLLG